MDLRLRTIPAVVVALAMLAGVAGCYGMGGPPRPGRTVSVENDVTVGDTTWQVLDLRRTPYLDKRFTGATRARGVFVALLLRAERQSSAGTINANSLSIEDAKHREFPVDDQARLALDQSGLEPLETRRMMAKTPVEGWVVFDVAPNARGLRLKAVDTEGRTGDYAYIRLP